MNNPKHLLVLTFAALLFPVSAVTITRNNFAIGDTAFPSPTYQAGIGVEYRVDDASDYHYVPSVSALFLRRMNSIVSFRAGLLYNSLTRLSSAASFHTVAGDVGFRFAFPRAVLTPFIETGLWLPYYWGIDWGDRYNKFHPGVRLAVGLSVDLSRRIALDAGVAQVLNHLHDDVIYTAPPPFEGGIFGGFQDRTGAYNDTRVEVGLRFAF